jgi:hypothetical protein
VPTPFKRFLLMFLMLALPLQAFASAALLGCEFARQGSADKVSMDMADMDRAMSGCHDAPAENSSTPVGEHQCSHCAACYLATAIPIPVSTTALMSPIPFIPHLQRAESFSGFIPNGPERPPRTTSI